jgi:hypothetical protein
MTAPTPLYGANPYTGAYQKGQFDTSFPGGNTPVSTGTIFDALESPPSAGVTAAVSPTVEFAEATSPTPGANDDEPADVNPGLDPLYPDNPEGLGPSNP